MSLKTSKPRMFSTVMDVASIMKEAAMELINLSSQTTQEALIYSGETEERIIEADSIILAKLNAIYGADSSTTSAYRVTTPYCSIPYPQYSNALTNTGTGRLISVQANYQASAIGYTAGYILQFSSSTAFGLTSTLEGVQSTTLSTGLATSANGTSTNGDVTCLTTAWIAGGTAFVSGDKFYFSYIDCHKILNTISKYLAASFVLQNITAGQAPSESSFGVIWYKRGMYLLDKLCRPDEADGMTLTSLPSLSTQDTQVDYPIDKYGTYESTKATTDLTDTYS